MKRHVLSTSFAVFGFGAMLNSHALAVGPALDANHSAWDENAYYNGFGGPLPAAVVEGSTGFSTIGDYSGRTVALAGPDITKNVVDSTVLTTINTGLFSGTDANLYEFQVTNSSTFSASIGNTTAILALFNSSGGAVAASIGGTADAITSASAGVTISPGYYWIGIADSPLYPQNAEGQNLFGLAAGSPGVFTPAGGITDLALATDPHIAWTLPSGDASPLLANTSFVAPSSTITLAGSEFAVVPEPASVGLIGTLSLGLLARRNRRAR
jgi:hypothetical protein